VPERKAFPLGELGRIGWTRETTTTHSTAELAAWWWCKDRMTYRLAIKDQEKAFQPEGQEEGPCPVPLAIGIRGSYRT